MDLLKEIDLVPDFPKAGINFYDIQSLLKKPDVWKKSIHQLADIASDYQPEVILGIESRGFLLGLALAQILELPFGMIRKKGKLPGQVVSQDYELEYGTDTIEIQAGLISPGDRVAILDDLLATGGTMKASGDLVRKMGGELILGLCLLELHELEGSLKLDFPFRSLVQAPLNP